MTTIQNPVRKDADGDSVVQYIGVCNITSDTFALNQTFNKLTIRNCSAGTLTLTVGTDTYNINPFSKQEYSNQYSQFTLSSTLNSSEFEMIARYDKDDTVTRLDTLDSQLTDITKQANKYKTKSFNAQNLLDYLISIGNSDKIISGHYMGDNIHTGTGYKNVIENLKTTTGKYPALLGTDYCDGTQLTQAEISNLNQFLIEWYNNTGGIVQVTWHPLNPWTGDKTRTSVILADLVNPGKAIYTTWHNTLDIIATGLAELRDAGVPVIFRPLLEMNGNWNWWGWNEVLHLNDETPTGYVNLWIDMYNYFTKKYGLNNLLWNYSAQPYYPDQSGWSKPINFYYPGNDYVDIVGLSAYNTAGFNTPRIASSVNDILQYGKPIVFSECGATLGYTGGAFDNMNYLTAKDLYPQLSFFMAWCEWSAATTMSLVKNPNATQLMTNSRVITLDKVSMVDKRVNSLSSLSKLLDPLPQPVLALGQNKLFYGYNGSGIRVRRSNDNTEQDIGFYSASGNRNDTAITNFVGANSGFISKVYDQSGYINDASQATQASQPRIVNSGVIDAGLYFDGVDDFLAITNATSIDITAAPMSLFMKFNCDSSFNSQGYLYCKNLDSSGNCQIGMAYDGTGQRAFIVVENVSYAAQGFPNGIYTSLGSDNNMAPKGMDHVAGFVWDGTNFYEYIDGLLVGKIAYSGSLTSRQYITIGARGNTSSTRSVFFKGLVSWIGVWNKALTEQQIHQISK